MTNWLGVDFGTSNSAAAYWDKGRVVSVELEPGQDVIPTAVFFDFYERSILLGSEANKALIGGVDGRYMRSLKSVLGTSLMGEKRPLLGRRMDFYEIITLFLKQVKERTEAAAGRHFNHVVAGRPVFFHHADAGRDQAAQNDLGKCYHRAGFTEVRFVFEPVAAAYASTGSPQTQTQKETLGLVVDIGGGTSDFSVFRESAGDMEVLASNGLRLGGTNFDKQISFDHFMPLLGRGHDLKRRLPDGIIEAPSHIFAELATWEKIPFLYDPKSVLFAQTLERDAVRPEVFARLVYVLEMRLGHDLAFLAERTKIAYNQDESVEEVQLDVVERGLRAPLTHKAFQHSLTKFGEELADAVRATLSQAGVQAAQIDRIVSVGGSSSMSIVTDALQACLPNLTVEKGATFTSIVDGLAIASQRN